MTDVSMKEIPHATIPGIVGKRATLISCSCNSMEGMKGTVSLETRNTILIATNRGLKTVAKKAIHKLFLESDFGACFISGSSVTGRPEDRI